MKKVDHRMTRPLLLASQSNSGSTWTARVIQEATGLTRPPAKEWFNPILNHKNEEILSRGFGCELTSLRSLLVSPVSHDLVDECMRHVWEPFGWGFTKENFMAYKLPWMRARFNIVVLLPDFRSCFPPERLRVLQWYDSWFAALDESGELERLGLGHLTTRATTARRRAVLAWSVVRRTLQRHAVELKLPMLSYRSLLDAGKDELFIAFGFLGTHAAERAADIVLATRSTPPPPPESHVSQWLDAFEWKAEVDAALVVAA
jgi:hypothetical protein